MAAILGMDLGSKRIGIAIGDEDLGIATPLLTLEWKNFPQFVCELKNICAEHRIKRIVAGLPKTMKGEVGPAAREAAETVEKLRGEISCEWVLWDERLSSGEADRVLRESGMSQRKRRQVRDKLAAQRILQNYLDYERLKS